MDSFKHRPTSAVLSKPYEDRSNIRPCPEEIDDDFLFPDDPIAVHGPWARQESGPTNEPNPVPPSITSQISTSSARMDIRIVIVPISVIISVIIVVALVCRIRTRHAVNNISAQMEVNSRVSQSSVKEDIEGVLVAISPNMAEIAKPRINPRLPVAQTPTIVNTSIQLDDSTRSSNYTTTSFSFDNEISYSIYSMGSPPPPGMTDLESFVIQAGSLSRSRRPRWRDTPISPLPFLLSPITTTGASQNELLFIHSTPLLSDDARSAGILRWSHPILSTSYSDLLLNFPIMDSDES